MTESQSTEVAVSENSLRADIAALSEGKVNVWSSQKAETFKEKVALAGALTNATPLQEEIDPKTHFSKVFNVKNVIIQPVDMANEKTRELTPVPRIVLVDADGSSYHAMSGPLFKSLENIFAICGLPHTWNEPLPVVVRAVPAKSGGVFFTASIAE